MKKLRHHFCCYRCAPPTHPRAHTIDREELVVGGVCFGHVANTTSLKLGSTGCSLDTGTVLCICYCGDGVSLAATSNYLPHGVAGEMFVRVSPANDEETYF
jgi:hypothetical protein